MPKNARLMRGSRAPSDNDLRSRGCPDPDRMIIRTRRTRKTPSDGGAAAPVSQARVAAQSPRAHRRNVERLYELMIGAQNTVRLAREAGEPTHDAAQYARECRSNWLKISGSQPEARIIDVNQGSETNPVRAV